MGSGIIILPPLIYNKVGDYSLVVWGVTVVLGFVFALIFGKLSTLYKGEGGVSLATKKALGRKYQLLSSFYLIFAVFFGPVAVLLMAAKFLQTYFDFDIAILAFFIYIVIYMLLLFRIDFIGKIMVVVTSFITLMFLTSSIYTLLHVENFNFELRGIDAGSMGEAFLLAFWSIVGWEVIGSYSNEVKDTKTITKAVLLSAVVVSGVYILSALAISFGEFSYSGDFELVYLIGKLYGDYAGVLLCFVGVVLCTGTLILFVGSVARLISSLEFCSYSSKRFKTGAPIGALNILSFVFVLTLVGVYFKIIDIASLVAFSNAFFISNAIIGLISAFILFKSKVIRFFTALLVFLFFIILMFSNWMILLLVFGLWLWMSEKK